MKRNTITKFMMSVVLIVSACTDVLEVEPSQSLSTSIALSDYNGFQAALAGVYDQMQSTVFYGRDLIVKAEVRGDNAYVALQNSNRFISDYNYQLSNNTSYTDLWNFAYNTILRANNVINNIDNAVDATDAQRDQLLGEALAVRALAHFDLVRFFAKPYYDGNGSQPGVPVKLDGEITSPTRNTVGEVYTQIIADLTLAKSKLNAGVAPFNFTADAANALLSRVYLYQGDNAKAEQAATDVISTDHFALLDDLATLWTTSGTGEEIFTLNVLPSESKGSDNLGQIFNPGVGYGDVRVTKDLRDMFTDPADKRIDASFYQYTNGEYYVNKYSGENGVPGLASPKILRYAEVILNRAEARAKQGKYALALADLDLIRARADIAPIGAVADANVLTEVLNERRRELAFEGHRSFDLFRNQLSLVRIQCNSGLEVNVAGNCTVDKASNLRIYPIPQRELDANRNMVQNEGY
jgi:hypothetical protein